MTTTPQQQRRQWFKVATMKAKSDEPKRATVHIYDEIGMSLFGGVDAAELVNEVSHSPVARGADLVIAAATLPDGGALLRMAGTSVEEMGGTLRCRLGFLSQLVGDDLWSRKW